MYGNVLLQDTLHLIAFSVCVWKCATARYSASHTKTMLATRKSVQRSSRQSDHMKTSWPSLRDANWSGMDMSPVHQVWPKTILQGTVKRGRRQGRQKKMWEDNIRVWTEMDIDMSQKSMEKWTKLVLKSSVVPKRPSQLRDHHHHHHYSLNHKGRWGTTDNFATSFLQFSLFSTALWDLPNSRPVQRQPTLRG